MVQNRYEIMVTVLTPFGGKGGQYDGPHLGPTFIDEHLKNFGLFVHVYTEADSYHDKLTSSILLINELNFPLEPCFQTGHLLVKFFAVFITVYAQFSR